MSELFKYKDYSGSIDTCVVDKCLHGEILFIKDVITYEADTVAELENEFQAAVDDYIVACEELGREPQKPFSGSFNVRVTSEIHRSLALTAKAKNISLNECLKDALSKYISNEEGYTVTHIHRIEQPNLVFQQEHAVQIQDIGESPWQAQKH